MIGMALSDRLSGAQPQSLWKKTLLYVLSFGLGALMVAGVLGLVTTSVAGAILPGNQPTAKASASDEAPKKGRTPAKSKGGSKAKPPRGNEGAEAAK